MKRVETKLKNKIKIKVQINKGQYQSKEKSEIKVKKYGKSGKSGCEEKKILKPPCNIAVKKIISKVICI